MYALFKSELQITRWYGGELAPSLRALSLGAMSYAEDGMGAIWTKKGLTQGYIIKQSVKSDGNGDTGL